MQNRVGPHRRHGACPIGRDTATKRRTTVLSAMTGSVTRVLDHTRLAGRPLGLWSDDRTKPSVEGGPRTTIDWAKMALSGGEAQ